MSREQLHTSVEWETSKPKQVIFDHFFYLEGTNLVRKVHGRVKVVKRLPINGTIVKKDCFRKVYWDGYGHATVGTHRTRSRHVDIIFA